MLVKSEDLKPGYVLKSTTLPEPEQPRMPAGLDDDEIGWFVGMYIAEGHTYRGKIGISSHTREVEREQRLIALGEKFDGYSWTQQSSENGMVVFVESPVLIGILQAYVAGKRASGKHLHVRCWKRSNKFLDAVLRGYLEGDGHWDGKRWRVGFCKNDALAADLRTICSRLGYSLRLRRCQHTMGDRKFPGWRGSLAFDGSYRKQSDYQIVAIRQSRARKFWNIALVDEPHLFALSCGVLTCNSNPMPESVSGWRWERCRTKVAPGRPPAEQAHLPDNGQRPGGNRGNQWGDVQNQPNATWTLCPGCDKCAEHGGYVLRRGSWRHTRAHETVLMLARGMGYYADQERVREPAVDDEQTFYAKQDKKPHRLRGIAGQDGRRTLGFNDMTFNPAGRNPRSVLTPRPESYSGNHYAVFPRTLISPLLRATAPTRVCPVCAAPWCPVVERGEPVDRPDNPNPALPYSADSGHTNATGATTLHKMRDNTVLAHRPTCDCGREDWQPGWVLDPFVGSGTSLEVCRELGVNAIGLDISPQYLDEHAKPRIGQTPARALETLPLFEGIE